MSVNEHVSNREWLLSKLRAEIIGPDPAANGRILGTGDSDRTMSREESRLPKKQLSGEEVLWQDPPGKRYGAGILYPREVVGDLELLRSDEVPLQGSDDAGVAVEPPGDEKETTITPSDSPGGVDESEDSGVTLANAFRPSALGLSFLADLSVQKNGLRVEIVNVGRLGNDKLVETPAATYRKTTTFVGNEEERHSRPVWLRVPLLVDDEYPRAEFTTSELSSAKGPIRKRLQTTAADLTAVVVVRSGYSRLSENQYLITVSIVNNKKAESKNLDEQCLFQSGLRIRGLDESPWILPYPEIQSSDGDPHGALSDERINELLYRHQRTFAIGHGCAADWARASSNSVNEVWTDTLPAFETPTTSADLFLSAKDGTRNALRVSMRKLAGLDPADNGRGEIDQLVEAYASWIDSLKDTCANRAEISQELFATANGLIERCEHCLTRIRDGIAFLDEDSPMASVARDSFRLANHAMLIAQLRATRDVREPTLANDGRIQWTPSYTDLDPSLPHATRGYWRAFQIAFLLMSLRGIADARSDARDVVDLIWFPTGGGKTEAYLGLTVFTILFNRLSGRQSGGADVLMRYTLRLLTAQQFQRAATLFCALEHLRRKDPALGSDRFSIGLWVGGSSSPNTRKDALDALKQLQGDPDSENPFILLKCPWCAARFGPSNALGGDRPRRGRSASRRQAASAMPSVLGYQRYSKSNSSTQTVVFRCSDGACEYGSGSTFQTPRAPLPIVVIDEDLLEDPPNLVIGTVDKFALLAWRPDARRLFGIDRTGRHTGLPPSLIIQDELHLISGPLGSMVGAYEMVIERLCRKDGVGSVKPKIIASTATISRATEQIRHLYAREKVFLFPPSGFESGDSFFARDERNDQGNLKPGRLHVGILAPAHGSLQTTEARVFATLTQYAALMETDDAGRDPWWTLLCFFNSLRELGSAASLFVSDTRDYLRVILDRHGLKYELIRKLFEVTELTSRIRSDQVPKEIERLERPAASGKSGTSIDACLASNIIEVGVDISRLSLMAIVGQPKTTSQYIQVASRVGRDPEKPGLVVVLYGQSKPRDRSHYERFRAYHQKLYAQVEPTSVTPFSAPAVDRALHGIIVAVVRQFGRMDLESSSPSPFPLHDESVLGALVNEMVEERVSQIAPEEKHEVLNKLRKRLTEWRIWDPPDYGGFGSAPVDAPLMHPAGGPEPPSWKGRSWATLSSLRNVDASCEAEITPFFNEISDDAS